MTATMINVSTQTFQNVLSAPHRLGDYLFAYARYRKFKSIDPRLMQDVGVSQADVDLARYRDFLR